MRAKQRPIDMDEFVRLANDGTSGQRLAVRYGRALSTVLALGRREGIEIKGRKKAKAEARKILSGSCV
jgi:hypothetical protein